MSHNPTPAGDSLQQGVPPAPADRVCRLEIRLRQQRLLYYPPAPGDCRSYPVSTATNGPGEQRNSQCTPRGLHRVAEKFGDGCPSGTVFVARQATGEIYTRQLAVCHPQRDWILTRILRLAGCEAGRNLGGTVDSYQRCIYIHGSPQETAMGTPGSHGCIRMHNQDIVELHDRVPVDCPVLITDA